MSETSKGLAGRDLIGTHGLMESLVQYNDVSEAGSGFGTDTNRVTIIVPGKAPEPWPQASKSQVAHDLLDRLLALKPAAGASLEP